MHNTVAKGWSRSSSIWNGGENCTWGLCCHRQLRLSRRTSMTVSLYTLHTNTINMFASVVRSSKMHDYRANPASIHSNIACSPIHSSALIHPISAEIKSNINVKQPRCCLYPSSSRKLCYNLIDTFYTLSVYWVLRVMTFVGCNSVEPTPVDSPF